MLLVEHVASFNEELLDEINRNLWSDDRAKVLSLLFPKVSNLSAKGLYKILDGMDGEDILKFTEQCKETILSVKDFDFKVFAKKKLYHPSQYTRFLEILGIETSKLQKRESGFEIFGKYMAVIDFPI